MTAFFSLFEFLYSYLRSLIFPLYFILPSVIVFFIVKKITKLVPLASIAVYLGWYAFFMQGLPNVNNDGAGWVAFFILIPIFLAKVFIYLLFIFYIYRFFKKEKTLQHIIILGVFIVTELLYSVYLEPSIYHDRDPMQKTYPFNKDAPNQYIFW